MPFRSQRSHLAALILAGAALGLGSCALIGRDAPPPAAPQVPEPMQEPQAGAAEQTATAPDRPLPWREIDGGILSDSLLTGPDTVRFMRPVAVAARGPLVYIVDAGLGRLFSYDTVLDRLRVVLELKGVVRGEVSDIFVARDLSFFLADTDGGRVLHFDRDGNLLKTLRDPVNIGRPVTVAVNDQTGYIFIADGFNDDVLVYNPAGLLTGAIGVRGSGAGQFRGITALAQGPDGYYIATRYGAARVQVMGFDGAYLTSFQPDTVTFPTAIAVRADNRAYVSDYLSDDIKVFDNGRLVRTLGGHGGAPGRFRRITDLWLDGDYLYVADSLNGRIQMLPLTSEELPPAGSP
jgi:DNA-binding beta-propeller fold protein YncE